MTKPIEGVSERILSCATEEFLEKGYSDASLRTIAAKAGRQNWTKKDCLQQL